MEAEEKEEIAEQQEKFKKQTSSPPKSPPASSPPRSPSPEGAREGAAAAAMSSSSSSASASAAATEQPEAEETMDSVKFNADLGLAKTKMRTPVGCSQADAILRKLLSENLDNGQRSQLMATIRDYNAKYPFTRNCYLIFDFQ